MQNWILPGVSEKYHINKSLVLLKSIYPEMFLDNMEFRCFYGAFNFSIWNGGRISGRYVSDGLSSIREKRDFFNRNNIPIRLTLTNPLISEEHLSDVFSNLVLSELSENNINEALVVSPVLERYLRDTYPKIKLCSSTSKCLTNPDDLRVELNNPNFVQVCLDYNLNHNSKLHESLSQPEKDKAEFLCNAICGPGCKQRSEHYRLNGVSMLNCSREFVVEDCQICKSILHPITAGFKNTILPGEILELEKQGFSNFKLEGRTLHDIELICCYAKYLIKPEYQLYFITELTRMCSKM